MRINESFQASHPSTYSKKMHRQHWKLRNRIKWRDSILNRIDNEEYHQRFPFWPIFVCYGIHTHMHTRVHAYLHTCIYTLYVYNYFIFFHLESTYPNWCSVKKKWAHSHINVWAKESFSNGNLGSSVFSLKPVHNPRQLRWGLVQNRILTWNMRRVFFLFLSGNPISWVLNLNLRWQYPVTRSKGCLCLAQDEME